MDLFRNFRSEQTITVNSVAYTTEVETLARIGRSKGPRRYRWTIYGPTGYMVTYVVTDSPWFSTVKSELLAALR